MSDTGTIEKIPETFSVRLTDSARKDLAMIADRLHIPFQEALSRAVGTLAVLVEQDAAGGEVILKARNGIKQVLPIREG